MNEILSDVPCPDAHPWALQNGQKCCATRLQASGAGCTVNEPLAYSSPTSCCKDGGFVDCSNSAGGNCIDGPHEALLDGGKDKVVHFLVHNGELIEEIPLDPQTASEISTHNNFIPSADSGLRMVRFTLLLQLLL